VTPYYQDSLVTIYHGDCREVLPELSGVGIVATDPPYVLGMNSTEGKVGWGDLMNSATFYADWIRQCLHLTESRAGAAWVFTSWRAFPVLARASYEIPHKMESLLVWDKCWIGPGGHTGLRPSYELVALFAHRGFQVADRGTPDIWQSPYSSQRKHGHPAEKPVDLMRRIISAGSSQEGSVLDPFAGSGTTLGAAKDLGRKAIGIEIEERYCEIAAERMAQMTLHEVPIGRRSDDHG
jgi:site-specific DNA-methyltransferase (adenine-specific)